jgi:hypothetical protein
MFEMTQCLAIDWSGSGEQAPANMDTVSEGHGR